MIECSLLDRGCTWFEHWGACELWYSYHLRNYINSPNYFTKFQLFYKKIYLLANSRYKLKFTNFRLQIKNIDLQDSFSLWCILLFIRVKLGLSTLLYYFHIYFFTRITFNVDYTHILQFILFIPLFTRPNISIDICILI